MSVSVINRLSMVLHELESTTLLLSSGLFSCCRAFDFIVSPYTTINKPYVSEETLYCVCARIYVTMSGEEEEKIQSKIERFESYLNERLREDLRLCLEQRDSIFTEQADLLGTAGPLFFYFSYQGTGGSLLEVRCSEVIKETG
jgi:hypothetical protein